MQESLLAAAHQIWEHAAAHIDTLKLIDRSKLFERIQEQAAQTTPEASEFDLAARLVMRNVWELHPLHARLAKQMGEWKPHDEQGKAITQAWDILPQRLVEKHWDIVKKAAVRLHIPTEVENEAEFQELMGVGREALFIAAQKFFRKPKGPFKNYAWNYIREAMREEQRNRHPVPPSVLKKLAALSRLREEYHLRDLRLTKEIIQRELRVNDNEIGELLATEAVWGSGQAFEHDHVLEDLEVADHSVDQLGMMLEVENAKMLEAAMENLDEPDSSIIRKLYFEERSYREAAEELGMSLPAFKRNHKRAIESMRSYFEADRVLEAENEGDEA